MERNIHKRGFNRAKSWIFEKIKKMDRFLERKKGKAQINIMKLKGDISIVIVRLKMDMQKI